MPLLHLVRVPSVGVEARGVIPDGRVVVDVMQGGDDDCVLGDFVSAWQDQVELCGAAGLEGGVVPALRFLDVFVQEGELIGKVGGDFRGIVEAVVDQFLQQTVLHAGVGDQAVDKPGEERAGGREAGAGGYDEGPDEAGLGQFLAFVVGGAESIVCLLFNGGTPLLRRRAGVLVRLLTNHVRRSQCSILQGQILDASPLRLLHRLLDQLLDARLRVPQTLGIPKRQASVPVPLGRDLLIQRQDLGDQVHHLVDRRIRRRKVLKVQA